jgi:hypothetical protein
MKILKGTILIVNDSRKGYYEGIAYDDFDTEDEWYRVQLHQDKSIRGCSQGKVWYSGEEISARKGIAKVHVKP